MSADSTDNRPRLAMVIEGSRSHADHRALTALAKTATELGCAVTVLHHGLGRLSRHRLRQKLRAFAPDLFVVSGAASLAEVRPLATLSGKPIVACYWPHGVIHNPHAPQSSQRALLPSHAIIATDDQRKALETAFASQRAWSSSRVHQFLAPSDEQSPDPQQLRALCELLTELCGERAHRSFGHGLLKASAARVLTAVARPRPLSLAYHQVVPELRGVDLNLVVSASTFERQIRLLLSRGYRPLTQAAQAAELLSGTPSSRPSLAVSFDDGYLDTLTVAAPILKSLGVPFTVYFISDILAKRSSLPWYELVQHSLAATETSAQALAVLRSEPALGELNASSGPGFSLIPTVMMVLKRLSNVERRRICARLWDEVGSRVMARPQTPRYLDSDGAKQLLSFGAELSSHTCQHPILTQTTDAELQHELSASRRFLLDVAGQCPGLAYPNGDSDGRVEAAAQAAGYDYAVRIAPSAGPPKPYRLGRQMISELSGLGLDGSFSEQIFLAKLLRGQGG